MSGRGQRPAASPSSCTVGDLLGFDIMASGELLAGETGLDRSVTGVNIIEVPEVGRWLRGGEFLFSAGYAWRGDPGGFSRLIRDLDRIGASGIGLKVGPYLSEVAGDDLALADELGFPVVRLPSDLAYMDVIEPLYQRLAARRLWLLERSNQVQQAIVLLGLDDQSMADVVAALVGQFGSPLHVVDLIDACLVSGEPGEPVRTVPLADLTGADVELVAESDRLGVGRGAVRTTIGDRQVLMAPLVVARRVHGRVVLVEGDHELDDVAELTLAHGAETLSFLLMKRLATLEGRRDAAALFLASLLSDRLSPEETAERALTVGLRLTQPCVALLLAVRPPRRHVEHQEAIRRAAERALGAWAYVTGDDHGQLLALVQVGESGPAVAEVARSLVDAVRRVADGDVLVACGSPMTGVHGVRRSRSEALIAMHTTPGGTDGVVNFAELGVERLLSQIPDSEITRDYLDVLIGPILDDPELLRTLEVYLECGCRKVAAAAAIPLHRSSLEYRLEKIARRLDVDLDDPGRILELWLALRLHRMRRLL